jgi:hypothetical protein
MSPAFHVQTARTADNFDQQPALSALAGLRQNVPECLQYSNSTNVASAFTTSDKTVDAVLSIPNQYPNAAVSLIRGKKPMAPSHTILQSRQLPTEEANTLIWSSLRKIAAQSLETKPTLKALTSASAEPSPFALFIIAIGIQGLASKEANERLSSARAAVRANDMRTAYENAFRGLDVLLRSAKWKQISSELEEMCSGHYPVAFATGAMRFVSDAAPRIQNWNLILKKLETTAGQQKVDVENAMRGLVKIHGAP